MVQPDFLGAKAGKCTCLASDRFHKSKQSRETGNPPVPSTTEILQAISANARVFAKLDAIHGYFQLALDEKGSMLTTFLLPQGKFRYLRAHKGLNANSDKWCCRSDVIIHGLPWARKIVDDTLIWARNYTELIPRVKIVLDRCHQHNTTNFSTLEDY